MTTIEWVIIGLTADSPTTLLNVNASRLRFNFQEAENVHFLVHGSAETPSAMSSLG